jgi:GT2 family glycosyltransferase
MIGHRSVDMLSRAIRSLTQHSMGNWELVLVVNGDSPAVGDFATSLLHSEHFPLAVVRISERRPGAARNAALRVARAPVLLFLDDDIECFQDITGATAALFEDQSLMAAGGANLTPPESGALERATGGVMSSFWGAAWMSRRYRLTKEGEADEHSLILCNLAIRKEVFQSEDGFNSQLISNEENVLLQRLALKGARLLSSPSLAVYHRRRKTWRGVCSQASKYGSGRAQNLFLVPESLSILYFLPLFLTLYSLALPTLVGNFGLAATYPLIFYFALAIGSGSLRAFSSRDFAQLLGVLVMPAVHVSYSCGFMRVPIAWAWRRVMSALPVSEECV